MKGPKYSNSINEDLSRTLNKRVNQYFKENGLSKEADTSMAVKTLLLFGAYFSIYLIILSNVITNIPVLFVLWAILGLLQAFIGMSIMHDTVHGAYTKNKMVRFVLQVPIVAIGVEPKIWHIEHNVLHHNYPNVGGIDQDINPRVLFRFTKHQPRQWFHRFQHIYATFLYGLLVIEWLTIKDLRSAVKYFQQGFIQTRMAAVQLALTIVFKKLIFYLFFLAIPLMILPFDYAVSVGMFLTMLVVAGITLTLVFQLAHVVPDCKTEKNAENLQDQNWHAHQLQTTSNFAHNNKLLSYLIGGLNYQIEHHLFPGICHIHYPQISKIVKQTAMEFSLPYHYEETVSDAIRSHYRLLRDLGREEG
ncbi:MAG: acyl-CoA desaturase [Crocinitomicaceae bacterium]|nr:acyl-CoA desaturase [Crocinitomicaceae bacterium]|tara:strand:+ start:22097 stop:23179 length:1083 start_codon:yes stop_codon:yes gene_type:complete